MLTPTTSEAVRNWSVMPLAIAVGLILGSATAQSVTDNSGSSSVNYFSESKTGVDGGDARSANFVMTAMIGEVDPSEANSANFRMAGGYIGTLDAKSTGPWITAAGPTFILPRSSNLVWLTGTRLLLSNLSVTVSGKPATVVAKSPTDVAVRMPSLSAPGWHQITLRNNGGTTSLERGIGVLPMLFTVGASGSNVPFDLIFKGTQGDVVAWVLAFSPGPLIPLGNYLHGLTIGLSPIRALPTLAITDRSGEFRLPVPPVPFNFKIYAQALFITNNPGYSPGSFSNRIAF